MKINVVEDISAPIEYVFARVTDFETFERGALRRGAKVQRVEDHPDVIAGTKWDITFMLRGAQRNLALRVAECDRPNSIEYRGRIKGLVAVVSMDLVALSPSRTRLTLNVHLISKTMRAKLVIQSLRLAKRRINRKLRKSMGSFAEAIEEDFTRIA